jgi:hypothetical protein
MTRAWLVPAAVAALVLILGFAALDQYSVSWDEALGDMFFGERYLSYFTSFDARYLDPMSSPYPPDRLPDLSGSPFRVKPWEYYPVANILGAASTAVLFRALGLLDPFDAFHAINPLLAIPLVFALYLWSRRLYGEIAAATALLLLFLSPRIACDLLANTKDFPTMVFFTLTLLAFYCGWERGSRAWILAAGVLWGLTLGTKANAIFLPAIVIAFLAFARLEIARAGDTHAGPRTLGRGALIVTIVVAGALGVVVMVASWPYLWSDPVGRLAENLRYIAHQKAQVRPESIAHPLEQILFTTPLPFLALFAAGVVPLVKLVRVREPGAILVVAWIAVVLGRLHLPNAVNFDGVRHFLELFPPMAVIGGLGARWTFDAVRGAVSKRGASGSVARTVASALLVALLASNAWSLVRSHPSEIAYWNGLAGGLAGAQERRIAQSCDYWALSYRVGLRWLNANAPPGSVLAVPIAEHSVRLTAPARLRTDITLAALTTPVAPDIDPQRLEALRRVARERAVFVMFVLREDWSNALIDECRARLRPVAEWRTGGAPVLQIYRYPG